MLLGNLRLLQAQGINDAGLLGTEAERLQAEGQTAMFVALDGRAAGVLGVADPVKASTPEASMELHRLGACATPSFST